MNFIELLRTLETSLGYHQVPLNPHAHSLKDILEGSPLHHGLIKRLIYAIYTHNKCQRLTDPVHRDETFSALGPIRLDVLRAMDTDIDVYRLVDELCFVIEQALREPQADTARPIMARRQIKSAQIIPLEPFRRQRLRYTTSI